MIVYVFVMIWVPLFVYLANRQFKQIQGEDFKQDECVSIFGRIKRMFKKKTKVDSTRDFNSKSKTNDKKTKNVNESHREQKKNVVKEGVSHDACQKVIVDIMPVDRGVKKDGSAPTSRGRNIDGVYRRGQQTLSIYQKQNVREVDKKKNVADKSNSIKIDSESVNKVSSSDNGDEELMHGKNFRFKVIGWVLMLIAILPPSLVAGLKSYDVGADIGYVLDAVNNAQISLDFDDYLNKSLYETHNTKGVEKGYLTLVYALTHVIADPHFILFVLEFLTILFVALFAYKFRDAVDMTFVMTIYMLVWYVFTLTMKRQSLAIALVMYSLTFFRRKQYIRTLIIFLLALMMHKSSIVAIGIYILMFVSQSKIKSWKKNLFYSFCSFLMIFGTLCFEPLMNFFANVVHIIPEKYVIYLTVYRSVDFESRGSDILPLLVYIIMSIVYMIVMKKRKSKIDMGFVLMLLITDLAFLILNHKIVNLFRLGLYYYYPAVCLLVPTLPRMIKNKKKRSIFIVASIIFLSIIWIYKYPLRNQAEIFPYKSEILHISMLERDKQ